MPVWRVRTAKTCVGRTRNRWSVLPQCFQLLRKLFQVFSAIGVRFFWSYTSLVFFANGVGEVTFLGSFSSRNDFSFSTLKRMAYT